jgi:hypothetical protein
MVIAFIPDLCADYLIGLVFHSRGHATQKYLHHIQSLIIFLRIFKTHTGASVRAIHLFAWDGMLLESPTMT